MTKDFNPDDNTLKGKVISNSGSTGGMLVGNRHTENGIKAINKSTNQPIEMEGGEVVITRNAVSDNEKREFEGEMLTNRQILSRINEAGGGVAFAEDGMELPTSLYCCGKSYKYGGKTLSDYDILKGFHNNYRNSIQVSQDDALFEAITKTVNDLCDDLECDGTTKILSLFLDDRDISHKIFTGRIQAIDDSGTINSFFPHQWIEIIHNGQKHIIDFKSKMWMGNDVPEGIFDPNDYDNVNYEGIETYVSPLSKAMMYQIQLMR